MAANTASIDILLKRLRELRKKSGLTQEQFAERIGLSYKYYQQIELGNKRELRLSTVDRLAKGLGVDTWKLLRCGR
jgi:transcriptional regulator with XRE-family HTH domain